MTIEERLARLETAWGPDDEAVRNLREAYRLQKEGEAWAERFRELRKQAFPDSQLEPDEPESGSPS